MDNLINVVKYMEKQQHIMVKMLIHLGCRADLYDDFIRGCFNELDNLNLTDSTMTIHEGEKNEVQR